MMLVQMNLVIQLTNYYCWIAENTIFFILGPMLSTSTYLNYSNVQFSVSLIFFLFMLIRYSVLVIHSPTKSNTSVVSG